VGVGEPPQKPGSEQASEAISNIFKTSSSLKRELWGKAKGLLRLDGFFDLVDINK